MAEVMKDLLLSPGNNQDGPVNSEIQYLESKYPSSIDGISLRVEMRSLQGLKKAMPRISTKDFMGVLVASYSSLVPQCSKIATLYLIAPIQNAVVESVFSHQNLIITSRRFSILIKTVGRKVLVKYCANLFSEDQLDPIVERAAVTWLELKERRVGQGS